MTRTVQSYSSLCVTSLESPHETGRGFPFKMAESTSDRDRFGEVFGTNKQIYEVLTVKKRSGIQHQNVFKRMTAACSCNPRYRALRGCNVWECQATVPTPRVCRCQVWLDQFATEIDMHFCYDVGHDLLFKLTKKPHKNVDKVMLNKIYVDRFA